MGFKRKRNQDFGQDTIVGGVLPYFGSNDKDQQNDYLSDIDISEPYSTTSSSGAPITLYSPADPTNQPKIRTPTRFRSGVLKFRTPEDNQEITIITESMSGSYNLALPAIGSNDRLLTRDTANSILNLGKSALPGSVAYEDEANVFTASQKLETYSELKAIAVPGNPAAGYVRLYIDSGDNKIKVKRSDGSVIDLEASGGGGGGLDERVIMKVAGSAVSASSRLINLVDASLFEAIEDVPNDQFNFDIKDGGVTNAHLAGSITNAKLLQITDKAKLPTSILYNDVNNSLGSHFMDIAEIVEPTTPALTAGRMYLDTADNHLKVKKGSGTVVDLESGGGGGGSGGGMAAGGTALRSGDATTTVFTIAHGLSPIPELYWAEAASDDAISNRKTTITSTNIVVTYAVPPPTGTNNLTFHWAAGYINPESGGSGGGGFSAGGSINKSGDGTTTTVTIAHGLATMPDIYFAFPTNDAARGSITYSVDTTNIILTYPIAPAEGTNNLSYVWGAGYVLAASNGFTPTSTTVMTGKTMSGASNTFSNIPLNSLANVAVSGPTTNQVLQYNGTNWINATAAGGGSVTPSSTDTFTNKTLSGTNNTFSNIGLGSVLFRPATAGSIGIDFGSNDAGGGGAFLDFHISNADGDYSSRIIRNPGANGTMEFNNTGTGGIVVQQQMMRINRGTMTQTAPTEMSQHITSNLGTTPTTESSYFNLVSQIFYTADDAVDPFDIKCEGISNMIYYGSIDDATASSPPPQGSALGVSSVIRIHGSGSPNNEIANFFAYQSALNGAQCSMWFTDWGMHGPVAAQPGLFNGITMVTNNYYNAGGGLISSRGYRSAALNLLTFPGMGPAGNAAPHASARVYPMEMAIYIGGRAGTGGGSPILDVGFKTGIQIGSWGSWMGSGSVSRIDLGITLDDIVTTGIEFREPVTNATGTAIKINNATRAWDTFLDLSTGLAPNTAAIKIGAGRSIVGSTVAITDTGGQILGITPTGASTWVGLRLRTNITTVADGSLRGNFRLHNVQDNTNDEHMAFEAVGTSGYIFQSLKAGTGSYRDIVWKNAALTLFTLKATGAIAFFGATGSTQGASIADATDLATAISRVNAVISRLEAFGLIATI